MTVIAVNMTIMVGWGAVKVLVPEVSAYGEQAVRVMNKTLDVNIKMYADWPAELRGLPVTVHNPVDVYVQNSMGSTVPVHCVKGCD